MGFAFELLKYSDIVVRREPIPSIELRSSFNGIIMSEGAIRMIHQEQTHDDLEQSV